MAVVGIIILVVPNIAIASSDHKGVVEAITEALPGSGVNVLYSFRL